MRICLSCCGPLTVRSLAKFRRAKKCLDCHRLGSKLKNYGLSVLAFKHKVEEQQGLCAICLKKPTKLAVDHNHYTGDLRDLLCNECNTGLGFFKENTVILQRAILYLNKHKKPTLAGLIRGARKNEAILKANLNA